MSLVLHHQPIDKCQTHRRWRYHLGWLALAVAVLAVAAVCQVPQRGVTLPGIASPLPEFCLSRRVFHLDCPGCGLTRCFIALAHGEIARAWAFNPAGLLWFAALVWQLPYRAIQLCLLRSGREIQARRGITAGVVIVLVAACVAQWIAKLVGPMP
jgi:hypothetical protein